MGKERGKEVREAGKEEGKKDNLKMKNASLSLQSAIPYYTRLRTITRASTK